MVNDDQRPLQEDERVCLTCFNHDFSLLCLTGRRSLCYAPAKPGVNRTHADRKACEHYEVSEIALKALRAQREIHPADTSAAR